MIQKYLKSLAMGMSARWSRERMRGVINILAENRLLDS
jgi:hypothetical protein